MGVPIRLIRTDGTKIPLMAESITMTVDRSVGAMPLPLKGSQRLGLDLNRSKAAIVITGVLTDDDSEATQSGIKSFCSIDFGRTIHMKTWFAGLTSTSATDILALNATPYYNKEIILLDKNAEAHIFKLSNQAALNTIGSTGASNEKVSVGIGDATSAADVAAALVLGINHTATHPDGIARKPGNFFTGSAIASDRDPTQGNCKVKIVQDFDGEHGGAGPDLSSWTGGYSAYIQNPKIRPHSARWKLGGIGTGSKSAGDKTMDLWGVFNNMNNSGADLKENILPGDWFDTYQENVEQDDADRGDYIIGIQIPYNSKVKATGAGEDFVQRNFFMPTGKHRKPGEKGSESNNALVDVDFRQWDAGSYKGIKGTIQQFVITYDAGETVYNYQMTFLPIDVII